MKRSFTFLYRGVLYFGFSKESDILFFRYKTLDYLAIVDIKCLGFATIQNKGGQIKDSLNKNLSIYSSRFMTQ